ncbi:MAG: ECF transporter S component [Clostridiales bacterium]|nr:ECF transporter S component [Clostridiales bacterium]
MKDKAIRKLVLSAMFAALSCAATMVIQIPIATGYLNFGDGLCLLAGWILGPWYGFAAAGLGSALADLLAGYGAYVPATFVIKGLVALIAALLLRLVRTAGMPAVWQLALSALPAEAAMVLGYFSFETLVLGETAAAAAAVPNNLLQAAAGIVLAVLLEQAVCRVPGLMRPSGKNCT